MQNRDNEYFTYTEVVSAEYPGMKKIQAHLEKDEPWDPITVLKTFYEGELKSFDIRMLNGMTYGEAKKYLNSISR